MTYAKKKSVMLKAILVMFLFALEGIYGQNISNEIDSLLQKSETLRGENKLRESFVFLQKAELQANKHNPVALAQIYGEFVKYYFATKQSQLAKEYASKAFVHAETLQTPEALAYGYYARAYYYNYLDIRNLAIENSQQALLLAQENDILQLKPRIYYLLYGAYSSVDDVALAEKYAKKTIETAQKVGNYNLLSNAYSAMSTVMGFLYQKETNQVYRDSILLYLNKSASLYKQFPSKVSPITYAITNINIADYYYRNEDLSKSQTLDSIKKYTFIAKDISKENNSVIQANASGLLAEIAVRQGELHTAESLLTEAFIGMNQQEYPDYYTLIALCEALSKLYYNQGNYEKALHLKTEKENYNAKLYNQNQLEQVSRLEAEFENKQIKKEMATVKELAENRKLLNYLYISISILILTLLFFVLLSVKNKSKLQVEKQLRLEKEKDEAKAQLLLKEKERRLLSLQKSRIEREVKMQLRLEQEAQARLKVEQELLQLKNEKMQKEVLANALQIERKNKLLEEIKDKIKQEGNTFNIDRVLRNEKFVDESIEQSVKEFEDIHPDFFNKLNSLSENKLTPLDLKYCAYIFLKLSTKDIATAFNVEVKSIRMSKYRIKQKLNLEKKESLEEFLQTLV